MCLQLKNNSGDPQCFITKLQLASRFIFLGSLKKCEYTAKVKEKPVFPPKHCKITPRLPTSIGPGFPDNLPVRIDTAG